MIKRIILFLALLSLSAPVYAAPQCYSAEEVRAEQLLRLHSELMVITVTCHQSSMGDNLIPYYTGFTKINIQALHDAEQTLIQHYKANYGGNGIDRLDKLRTRLGNEFGQVIADVSAPRFCAERRDKVPVMYRASADEIDAEVRHLLVTAKPYEKPCKAHIAKEEE